MSEFDDDLKKAFRENGSFDPEKAEEMKKRAVGTFNARMRKVERVFEPSMSEEKRARLYAGWKEAVARVRSARG